MKTKLTGDEKNDLASAAYASIQHPVVRGAMEEFALNMRFELRGLPEYGLEKVTQYAAIAARCEALGIDPDAMRMDDDEVAEHRAKLARAFLDDGKPVVVVETGGG